LLLPDIEGVDTPDEQIAIALRKAGINKREKYTLEYFEVVRHK
jgi:AMMECR1 domain-containing protein